MHEFGAICKESRKQAGLTIESAASLLYISESSLSRYESGETIPTPTTVMNMMRHYNDPYITLNYCKTCCPIGAAFSFVVDQDIDFYTAVLKYADAERIAHQEIPEFINVSAELHTLDEDTKIDKLSSITRNLLRLEHTIEMVKLSLGIIGVDVKGQVKEYNRGYVTPERKRLPQMAV